MIQYKNITVKFNGKPLFKSLNLQMPEGEKAVIFGRSGLGKTTLFSLLLGFLAPDEGEILFKKEKITAQNIWSVRKAIAFVGQDAPVNRGRAGDVIEGYFRMKVNVPLGIGKAEIAPLVDFYELGNGILSSGIDELSGGERQRIALIIAELLGRKVFLLDEATSALDARMKKKVIERFTRDPGWTVAAITHDETWLVSNGIRVYDMEEGKWR